MTTPTPAAMPQRRRIGRIQLDAGGPMQPGHHQCLRDVDAGLVVHVAHDDGHHHWEWAAWPGVRIPRPRRWYLDELYRAGLIQVDEGGAVQGVAA
jgi:hypothetical protein